jgi:hypothetical protein
LFELSVRNTIYIVCSVNGKGTVVFTGGGDGSGDMKGTASAIGGLAGVFSSFANLVLIEVFVRVFRAVLNGVKGAISSSSWSFSSSSKEPGIACARTGP